MNNEIVKINQRAFELVLEDEMNEKTITMQEIADAMGVSKDTIRNCVRRVFPDKMKQGKTAYFNEAEVAVISKELKNNTMVEARITSENFSQVKNTTTELEVLANALNAFKALQDLYTHKEAEYKATIEAQKEKIALDAPKVDTYNRIANSTGLKTMQEAAKLLGIGSKTLFAVLRDRGIFYKTNGINLPAEKYIKRGLFEVKEEPYKRDNKDFVYTRVFATAKGLLWLEKQIAA